MFFIFSCCIDENILKKSKILLKVLKRIDKKEWESWIINIKFHMIIEMTMETSLKQMGFQLVWMKNLEAPLGSDLEISWS